MKQRGISKEFMFCFMFCLRCDFLQSYLPHVLFIQLKINHQVINETLGVNQLS